MNFAAGQEGEVGGIRYRVAQGRKGPDDLRLDIWDGTIWRAAPMALGGLMADFFYQNEERLYPRAYGFRGGDMYFNFLLACIRRGWTQAWIELEAERRRRVARDKGNDGVD